MESVVFLAFFAVNIGADKNENYLITFSPF